MVSLGVRSVGIVVAFGGLLAGCGTLNPLDLPQDSQNDASGWVRPQGRECKVMVVSRAGIYLEDGSDRAVLNTERVKSRVQSLTEKELNSIRGVSVVNLDNVQNLDAIKVVGGALEGIGELPDIDYVLTADSTIGYYADPGSSVNVARKARGVSVETLYTLGDVTTKLSPFSESFASESFGDSDGDVKGCIDEVVKLNAKKLKGYYLKRYVAIDMDVKECRGGGRFALVDYPVSAKECIHIGDEVSFYMKRRNSNGKWNDTEVATGRVYMLAPGASMWVEINDFTTAGVMGGHFAKMVN